jgi:hypothetical protein
MPTANRMSMKAESEIIARIEARKDRDIFGFEWPYYLDLLPFEAAKPYLKEDATGEDWKVKTLDEIRAEAVEYMSFAWDKANNCRGISASRSISHYQAWLWALGADETWVDGLSDYQFYGKPQLVEICNYLGLDSKQWDDGIRSNSEY